jgi:GWxTD domain-containing protein
MEKLSNYPVNTSEYVPAGKEKMIPVQKLCHHILMICGFALLMTSCGSRNGNQGYRFNKPVLYNPASSSLHPKLGVFHVSDNESQLYIMLNTAELLVSEANKEGLPKSDVKIHYELYDCTDVENNKLVSDSSTFINSVEIKPQQKIIVFPIQIQTEQGRRYLLLVQTTDLLRRNTIRQFITVNKTNMYSMQNFRLSMLNGSPKPENTISENEIFRIEYRRKPIDKLFIKYMNISQPFASSPLALEPTKELVFKHDSIWEQQYDPSTNFMFGYEGLYLIQADTSKREGLLLMNFGTSYPVEDRTAQLVQPIQYIIGGNEYLKLSAAQTPKKMMDNFWLAATGSTDKARMLIRVFYTRMSYANRYFTDFKEGWKTDRGMIYMIYGLPNNIHKSSGSETWEYTRKQQANPVTFVFDRKASPYSEEYYVLRRGEAQPTYWRQAIDVWRKGQIFSINDLE